MIEVLLQQIYFKMTISLFFLFAEIFKVIREYNLIYIAGGIRTLDRAGTFNILPRV